MKKRSPVIRWNPEGQPSSAKEMMRRYRRHRNRRIRVMRLQYLELDWPHAVKSLLSTFEYVTDGLVYRDGTPVVHRSIDEMLTVYETAWLTNVPDQMRLSQCMGVLVRWVAASIGGICITAEDGARWRPQDGTPLLGWIGQHGTNLKVESQEPEPTGTCHALTRYILTDAEASVLRDYPGWSEDTRCQADFHFHQE